MVTVDDCERVQSSWFRTRARLLGGEVWEDDGICWSDGPDGQNLLFPSALPAGAVERGLERARANGYAIVGAWLGLDVDASALSQTGFERGWAPWWMTAELTGMPDAGDTRVALREPGDDPEALAIVRTIPRCAWHAEAYADDGRSAGHAWSFLNGTLAGVFDMEVWRPFQRRGLGRSLLRTVCAAAREAGAEHAVLNATPEGKRLYESCGFRQIGEGITWWHHMGA